MLSSKNSVKTYFVRFVQRAGSKTLTIVVVAKVKVIDYSNSPNLNNFLSQESHPYMLLMFVEYKTLLFSLFNNLTYRTQVFYHLFFTSMYLFLNIAVIFTREFPI